MIAVDSSVAIAGFASWHGAHSAALKALDRRPRLIAHAAIETYSVLTRLPAPHRAPPDLVRTFISERFADPFLRLSEPRYRGLLTSLAAGQIQGGSAYDALIGLTAVDHGATLLSLDRRAGMIYDLVGVSVEYLG